MTPNNLVHENERLDELHRNGYYIIQDPARFCFGMDAVLLSGFARARRGERVLDLGTGTGIIPILMEAKTEAEDFTALEIQEESADMARRSVLYNHLEEKIRVVTGDIKDASGIFGASSFDIVTTNPPYMIGQHGISSGSEAKAIARHEVLCTLDDILRESAKLLVPGFRQQEDAEGALYAAYQSTEESPCQIELIPYYAWCNRGEGEMRVWLNV